MELEDRRGFPRPIVCPSYSGSLRLRDRKEREREREREREGGGETDGDDGNDGEAETAFLRIIYSPASTPGRSIMHPLKSTGVRNCPVKFRR